MLQVLLEAHILFHVVGPQPCVFSLSKEWTLTNAMVISLYINSYQVNIIGREQTGISYQQLCNLLKVALCISYPRILLPQGVVFLCQFHPQNKKKKIPKLSL